MYESCSDTRLPNISVNIPITSKPTGQMSVGILAKNNIFFITTLCNVTLVVYISTFHLKIHR